MKVTLVTINSSTTLVYKQTFDSLIYNYSFQMAGVCQPLVSHILVHLLKAQLLNWSVKNFGLSPLEGSIF